MAVGGEGRLGARPGRVVLGGELRRRGSRGVQRGTGRWRGLWSDPEGKCPRGLCTVELSGAGAGGQCVALPGQGVGRAGCRGLAGHAHVPVPSGCRRLRLSPGRELRQAPHDWTSSDRGWLDKPQFTLGFQQPMLSGFLVWKFVMQGDFPSLTWP